LPGCWPEAEANAFKNVALQDHSFKTFWQNNKKDIKKHTLPSLDGATGNEAIAATWKKHDEALLNTAKKYQYSHLFKPKSKQRNKLKNLMI